MSFEVNLLESSKPTWKPSANDWFKVKAPLAEPTAVSFCLFLSGTNASMSSLNFNLFPACEER